MQRLMVISSDGHATARMNDYEGYLDPGFREEFRAFCVTYRERGSHTFEERALAQRLDPYLVDEWRETVIDAGRLEGNFDPRARVRELDTEGVAAEVLFPDFGLPFELYSPLLAAQLGEPVRDEAHVVAGNDAYNRWLVDFTSDYRARFAMMASISFTDPRRAVSDLRWAKESGFTGVMLPHFPEEMPLYAGHYDPIWDTCEELDLLVNSHVAISSISTRTIAPATPPPHPVCMGPLFVAQVEFFCRQILDHLIWGGVLERHPRLKVVLTEQGSGWVPSKLAGMDYSYDGSYLRHDIREVIRHRPSEYFARQVYLGSSLLTQAEVALRDQIGVDKMMIGVDYPHHEGMWNGGTQNYLQATFGANQVPVDEARRMVGGNAVGVFGFDPEILTPIGDRIGPEPEVVLTPPAQDLFPRGDVHKPLGGANIG
jgi:predicted TIM-barrel fold metal-dependent hydrolase